MPTPTEPPKPSTQRMSTLACGLSVVRRATEYSVSCFRHGQIGVVDIIASPDENPPSPEEMFQDHLDHQREITARLEAWRQHHGNIATLIAAASRSLGAALLEARTLHGEDHVAVESLECADRLTVLAQRFHGDDS